ncbi:MAG: tail assembly protein [Kiritimatiellia bacterium]
MRTVILYGELAKRFGREHKFAVKNVHEAIRALKANFAGFASYMGRAHLDGYGFKIFTGGSFLTYDELGNPCGSSSSIRIVPVLLGAGSGWFKVLLGAVLVAAGIIVTGMSFGSASQVGGVLISVGAGLIFGGVADLLTSPPKGPLEREGSINKNSYLFNGPANVTAQGHAIPVFYGRLLVGTCVVSAGVESYEQQ